MNLEQAILERVRQSIGPEYSIVNESYRENWRKWVYIGADYNIYHRAYPAVRAGGFCVDNGYAFRLVSPPDAATGCFVVPHAIRLYVDRVVAESIASALMAMKSAA